MKNTGEHGISLFKMFSKGIKPLLTDVCPCQFDFILLQQYGPDDPWSSFPVLHPCEAIGSSEQAKETVTATE